MGISLCAPAISAGEFIWPWPTMANGNISRSSAVVGSDGSPCSMTSQKDLVVLYARWKAVCVTDVAPVHSGSTNVPGKWTMAPAVHSVPLKRHQLMFAEALNTVKATYYKRWNAFAGAFPARVRLDREFV